MQIPQQYPKRILEEIHTIFHSLHQNARVEQAYLHKTVVLNKKKGVHRYGSPVNTVSLVIKRLDEKSKHWESNPEAETIN